MKQIETVLFRQPTFRRKLFVSDRSYCMKKLREEGERDLVRLCKTVKREDIWTFHPDRNLWLYYLNEHNEDKLTFSVSENFSERLYSIDQSPIKGYSHYHTHPDYFISQIIKGRNQEEKCILNPYYHLLLALPSEGDLETSLNDPNTDYRIASSNGITQYKAFSPKILERNAKDLLNEAGLVEELRLSMEEGFQSSVKRVFERINERAKDSFKISFQPIH